MIQHQVKSHFSLIFLTDDDEMVREAGQTKPARSGRGDQGGYHQGVVRQGGPKDQRGKFPRGLNFFSMMTFARSSLIS